MTQRVILDISDDDLGAMADSVMDPEQWIRAAVVGKVSQSRKRMQRMWIPKLRAEGRAIPPTDVALEALIKAHPNYKTRAERPA